MRSLAVARGYSTTIYLRNGADKVVYQDHNGEELWTTGSGFLCTTPTTAGRVICSHIDIPSLNYTPFQAQTPEYTPR